MIALEEALSRLQEIDPQAADLITLHFFAGFTLEQAGESLGVSQRKACRQWESAGPGCFVRFVKCEIRGATLALVGSKNR